MARYLKEYGIPLRPEDEAPQLAKPQLGYGERRVKNELLRHERELANIEKMKNLREQGFSYHKIADVLNSMGIATKNRNSRWRGTTVMKILKSK